MTGQANFLQSLGWAVLNSLWQLALLWVVYQILTAAFKSARPAAKSLLASSLLLLGFAWFVFTFFITFSTGNAAEIIIASGLVQEGAVASSKWLQKILPAASVLYLALLVIPLLHFVKNYRYVQVIRNYGLSKPAPEWRLFVHNIAARMGIRKPVHIWISEWVTSPVTIGFLKPVILVPMSAINHLNPQQMEAVLLHELSHIRRHDYLLNFILNIIKTILYFNPFAKAFIKIVETEREKRCDEIVLQFQYDSHQYASALLTLEKVSREYTLLIIQAAGSRTHLLHRVQSIMGVTPKPAFPFRRFGAAMVTMLCIIVFNAVLVLNKSKKAGIPIAYNSFFPSYALKDNAAYTAAAVPELPAAVVKKRHDNRAAERGPYFPDKNEAVTDAPFAKTVNPEIIPAGFEDIPEPELDKMQEDQVKEAIEASRKLLESQQWKAIEKTLADVFNQKEKESLKSAFKEEMSKFDWNKWENKLRLVYDKVDWEKVNYKLSDAINRMQTDSLVKVYSEAIVNLDLAQKELNNLSLKGIPDTDISLKALADKQRHLEKSLNNLKATRAKKIVHL